MLKKNREKYQRRGDLKTENILMEKPNKKIATTRIATKTENKSNMTKKRRKIMLEKKCDKNIVLKR